MKLCIATVMALMLSACAQAIETDAVELRHGTSNDGAVRIDRDAFGNMRFQDVFTSSTTLQDLAATRTDHGSLAGLADDDHLHYLNAARHSAAHTAAFNGALPIPGDTGGNATLGAHVTDTSLHLHREADEAISGAWTFQSSVGAHGGLARLGPGQFGIGSALQFEDGVEDAEVLYTPAADLFSFNRPVAVAQMGVTGTLSGAVAGVPAAEISGFATIEGLFFFTPRAIMCMV